MLKIMLLQLLDMQAPLSRFRGSSSSKTARMPVACNAEYIHMFQYHN